ncbi:hypothetical protein HDU84_005406 [Entophlyctis sp. JEL0112]|nr:hypothetical protein HDU84_005406 [Entophlyctis sp. JEL0112]
MQLLSLLAVAVSAVLAQSSSSAASGSASASASPATASASSAAAAATTTAAASGDTCTTSAGGAISIINPLSGSSYAVGSTMSITWDVLGSDTTFDSSKIAFGVVDATNSANAVFVQGSYIAQNVVVSTAATSGTVPSVLSNGVKYSVRSEYLDGTHWRYCFSPIFTVTGGVVTTTAAASNKTVTTTSSGNVAVLAAGAVAVAALAL